MYAWSGFATGESMHRRAVNQSMPHLRLSMSKTQAAETPLCCSAVPVPFLLASVEKHVRLRPCWVLSQSQLLLQAYHNRISQLFAGGADILDIKARSELASLVGIKVSMAAKGQEHPQLGRPAYTPGTGCIARQDGGVESLACACAA